MLLTTLVIVCNYIHLLLTTYEAKLTIFTAQNPTIVIRLSLSYSTTYFILFYPHSIQRGVFVFQTIHSISYLFSNYTCL